MGASAVLLQVRPKKTSQRQIYTAKPMLDQSEMLLDPPDVPPRKARAKRPRDGLLPEVVDVFDEPLLLFPHR